MTLKAAWSHHAQFLLEPEAHRLYRRMLNAPWSRPDAENMSACHFGLSYSQSAGGVPGEKPNIPDFLMALGERIAVHTKMPTNYVQCHRADLNGQVRPHRDPAGVIVPMLTVGAERTFRVGGDYPNDIPKFRRPIECHHPAAEVLMRSGDLLVFNGGRVAHSMHVAARDVNFQANGCAYRVSILFRWTTAIMRAMGPDRRKWSASQVQEHEAEYQAMQIQERQMQPSLF
jgi:hypothetical protein